MAATETPSLNRSARLPWLAVHIGVSGATVSLRARRIERCFGWGKTAGPLAVRRRQVASTPTVGVAANVTQRSLEDSLL